MTYSFVSEHIETLEEIDMEYKELALESGIKNWGRVPALGCTSTFISDLADAVVEALPSASALNQKAWRHWFQHGPDAVPDQDVLWLNLGIYPAVITKASFCFPEHHALGLLGKH